jgi:hypothetical protein
MVIHFAAKAYEPWFPEPEPSPLYRDDQAWQGAHLWDHITESDNFHGPFRGPTILHHPDLQYALDNGWRVVGGPKTIDHQGRGETGSGSTYLYKIGEDGLIHKAHLGVGPEEANMDLNDDEEAGRGLGRYGTVPENNWRHLIMGERGLSEGPEKHESLRDLVDDEKARSMDPTHQGYKDFKVREPNQSFLDPNKEAEWEKQWQHTIRRAWDTGTNDPSKHWDDPIPDPYANIDKIPRSPALGEGPGDYVKPDAPYGEGIVAPKHPRYGGLL